MHISTAMMTSVPGTLECKGYVQRQPRNVAAALNSNGGTLSAGMAAAMLNSSASSRSVSN